MTRNPIMYTLHFMQLNVYSANNPILRKAAEKENGRVNGNIILTMREF